MVWAQAVIIVNRAKANVPSTPAQWSVGFMRKVDRQIGRLLAANAVNERPASFCPPSFSVGDCGCARDGALGDHVFNSF